MIKPIKYEVGDATNPTIGGSKIIVHCCNSIGCWGRGFVLALSRRWKKPEQEYRRWCLNLAENDIGSLPLGETQFVRVTPEIIVANIIGQEGVGFSKDGTPPIRYDAIRAGLQKVFHFATDASHAHNFRGIGDCPTIVGPRFGSALAGGDWSEIEKIITEELSNKGLQVVIYDLPTRN